MRTFVNQQLYPGEFLLHKKYAQSDLLLELVWTHSNIVVDIALHLLDKHEFDKTELPREFVIQAGLLFDIGIYLCEGYEWIPGQPPSDKPYLQHGIIGAWILQQEGYSHQIIQVAHSHPGVGLTIHDVERYGLDLPKADYVPHTQLEKLISYASKFHSKSPGFKTAEAIKQSLSIYGKDKTKKFEEWEQEFGKIDLTEIQQKYDQWHQAFKFKMEQLTTQVTRNTGVMGPNLNSAGIP